MFKELYKDTFHKLNNAKKKVKIEYIINNDFYNHAEFDEDDD